MLSRYHDSPEIHLRATWIDTRADVVVNVGVLISGIAIALSGFQKIDLLTGLAIGIFVIKEGRELILEANH